MVGTRYATAVKRWGGTWCVAVHDKDGWCYMCEWSDEQNDWVTCTYDTEEQAEQAAKEYTEFWKEATI